MFYAKRLRLKTAAAGVFSAVFLALLFWFSGPARNGAVFGLMMSGQVLIPSLFAFLCVCEFVIRSGVSAAAGKLLSPAVRFLFYMPGACAAGILMSFLGGYPVGARSAAILYERGEISRAEARRMLLFCVNGGPAFIVFAVGDILMGSRRLGLLLLASHMLPSLLLGIGAGMYARVRAPRGTETPKSASRNPSAGLAESFVESVASASGVMLGICAFVVFFSAVSAALLSLPLPEWAAIRLPALLEITSGLAFAADGGSPWLLAAALSFGGLCVHFQVMSAAGAVFPKPWVFLGGRIAHALLSAGAMRLLLSAFPAAAEAFSNHTGAKLSLPAVSLPACAALVVMCAVFLWDSTHKSPNSRSSARRGECQP